MKGAVFIGKQQLAIKDIEMEEVKPDEVLVEIKACGVCGTDIHIYQGEEGAAPTPKGTIIGHEFSGIIKEAGKNVSQYQPGDRVSVDPNEICGYCTPCKEGKAHFCENMIGHGTVIHGGFAQYCKVKEKQIYSIPDHIDFMEAAMAEPVACCLHGMDFLNIKSGQTVWIIGAGTIGSIMLQLAKHKGASTIIVSEPIKEKREKAKRLGANLTIDPLLQNIEEMQKTLKIDVAIECVGNAATMKQAIEGVGKGGKVLLFGLTHPRSELTLNPFDLFKREVSIFSSFINPYTQKRAIDLISSGMINVKDLITTTLPLDQIHQAFEDQSLFQKGKIMVLP